MLEAIPITDKIVRVRSSSEEDLARHFVRFQEHYESPVWRGRIFSLDEYARWYTETHGEWSYYQDWFGFNLPSFVLKPFRDGLFDPLSAEEQALLALFQGREDDFYVIGSQDANSLEHEVAHGLFATVPSYQEEASRIVLANREALASVFEYVAKRQYHEVTHVDEVHAYAGVDYQLMQKKAVPVPESVHQALRALFDATTRRLGVDCT